MTEISENPPIKAAWMSVKTYFMLVGFGLIRNDHPLPFLHDGRIALVSDLMPSTGIYDAPTPALEKRLAMAQQLAEQQEMAA